jgi:hypothetical protein
VDIIGHDEEEAPEIQPATAIAKRGSATLRTDYAANGQHVHGVIEAAGEA